MLVGMVMQMDSQVLEDIPELDRLKDNQELLDNQVLEDMVGRYSKD